MWCGSTVPRAARQGLEDNLAVVTAGHSRSKNGVASARLCPAIHAFAEGKEDVDARVKPAHDGG
jgi:hypothetical protein